MTAPLVDRLTAMGACAPALEWLRACDFSTLQAAWDACLRGSWMAWLWVHATARLQTSERIVKACDGYVAAQLRYRRDEGPAWHVDVADACYANAWRNALPIAPALGDP